MPLKRIVEVSVDGRMLGVERGFLCVWEKGALLGKVPLDDICGIICTANYTLFTSALFPALSARNISLVVCDRKTKCPSSYVLPLYGNYRQSDVMTAQAQAPKPMLKGLWRLIIGAKIRQCAEVLKSLNISEGVEMVEGLSRRVLSDDAGNAEARAAAVYWKSLMGKTFVRDRNGGGANILFNYAYTILRAAMLRAISAAGLHPSLGIHHRSSVNCARLADDLMEPFRPFADLRVVELLGSGEDDLTKRAKAYLVGTLEQRYVFGKEECNIMRAMSNFAVSLAQVFLRERKEPEICIVKSKDITDGIYKRIQTDVDACDV